MVRLLDIFAQFFLPPTEINDISHVIRLFVRFVDSARLRLALFRPCHPEYSRNPSEARIKRSEATFGISDEKVRLASLAQNDTKTAFGFARCSL